MNEIEQFIEAACIPMGQAHSGGSLEEARKMLDSVRDRVEASIFLAACLGDCKSIKGHLDMDPALAASSGGPRYWTPLVYLCFSRFLREPLEGADFVQAARQLLEAGADPNSGFYETSHQPESCFESVLYGAAGIAHHETLTRLLLEFGADPNDGETPYHVPEGYDNGAFRAVFECDRLNDQSRATMLLRKIDFHDGPAIQWLMDKKVDPNCQGVWGKTAVQSAVIRGNHLSIIECLLKHGADPFLEGREGDAYSLAAYYGRADALLAFATLGQSAARSPLTSLLAACAQDEAEVLTRVVQDHPEVIAELGAKGGGILTEFAGTGNIAGIRHLLSLGLDINAVHGSGDAYFGITRDSTPLHAAAWRARHDTVSFLLDQGADPHRHDTNGRSALVLAVEACVNSYWTEMRSPRSVDALLKAGASVEGVRYPSGFGEVDSLLAEFV